MKLPVFISHIHEEQEVALAFKELVDSSFLGMIDTFVSSEASSMGMGAKWLDTISTALKRCVVEVIVCSPTSVLRPWIQFEAGAGWVRDIPVIPLCHSGLTPSSLPVPLNLLNGAIATDHDSVASIFPVLATALGSTVPNTDLAMFLSRMERFELHYMFWDDCLRAFRLINSFHKDMLQNLRAGRTVSIPLNEKQVAQIENLQHFLRENELVDYQGRQSIILGPTPRFDCTFRPLGELRDVLSAPECIL